MTQTPNGIPEFAKQEIRLAAVLNGGVSLAVWMSGVTLEMHHLAMSSFELGNWTTYQGVLDALGARARVDVIAGTSAGGLNGAFLALGIARRRDFSGLRDIWAQAGALDKLLRKPLVKDPPSVLAGDDYFLVEIDRALDAMATTWPQLDRAQLPPMPPVELILTGTLWEGRQTCFSDDMGTAIVERDYDATFRFVRRDPDDPDTPDVPTAGAVGDLMDPSNKVLRQLARAARCTSSFPGAFEPHYVDVGGTDDSLDPGRWASSAGQANFDTSQYVLDGGILLNKPLRPALAAIYRQTARHQVRRVLGYVVPDPGEAPTPSTTQAAVTGGQTRPDVPQAPEVLLSVLTRLTSTDSVSRELAEIRDTNASVRTHRRTRDRLSQVLAGSAPALADQLWPGYRDERISNAAATIARLLSAGQAASAAGARWTEQELVAGLERIGADGAFGFVPDDPHLDAAVARSGSNWTWGQTTLVRLSDMTTDLLRKAMVLAPVGGDLQQQIVDRRDEVRSTIKDIARYERDLGNFWINEGLAGPGAAADADPLNWLARIANKWDTSFEGGAGVRRSEQYYGALALAGALATARPTIAQVVELHKDEAAPSTDLLTLRALLEWMLPASAEAGAVLQRMLTLDVVLVATSGALATPEQTVELVQISCENSDTVTGMQLHHFGAFYRKSWRLNDWIEGRMDGIRQVLRLVLDPDRFRQLGQDADDTFDTLHALATDADRRCAWLDDADRGWLAERWDQLAGDYRAEVSGAFAGSVQSFDKVSDALAMPLRLQALQDDLPALAAAIQGEADDAPAESRGWLRQFQSFEAMRPEPGMPPPRSQAERLWHLRTELPLIGTQKINDDLGSDTFARTTSHAAVVTTGAFSSPAKLRAVKPIRLVMSALRGYTAMVYAMVTLLTRRSHIGPTLVGIAAAVGGALLAVALFVPSVPVGLTLVGVLLLFAGASAAALLTDDLRAMGLRVLVVVVVLAAALGWLIYRDIDRHGLHGEVISTLIKVAIGLGIVLVGWFVANGSWHRSRKRTQRAGNEPTSDAQNPGGARSA